MPYVDAQVLLIPADAARQASLPVVIIVSHAEEADDCEHLAECLDPLVAAIAASLRR